MYCILVTGIPAAGKSTMAKYLAGHLSIPMISKDMIKELLFDNVGFKSRRKSEVGDCKYEYYVLYGGTVDEI